ncbi:SDR family NAD(P)-dependent oxidoreductase [Psychromonas sp. PT13]|uniref:SDR family NAD(P)-dependent oxidoreductase n=1 Tax=Psychromonas sp. PT13 TaxID=3439547 RepID=UPI003EBB717D
MYQNIAVIGASGAIGRAFVNLLSSSYPSATLYAFSRNDTINRDKTALRNVLYHEINYQDESSIENAAKKTIETGPLDLIIVTTGILHDGELMPEKSLHDLSAQNFRLLFEANTILPALLIKHFSPLLNLNRPAVFALLSARVGSITDNKLGGWYAYRASKAALNMIIKNSAIEIRRKHKESVIIGLHPGTVDSPLSLPFQRHVPEGKLFTADFSAQSLLKVINHIAPTQSGQCFAWDGQRIEA